jgi:hypothetical protein
MEALCHLFNKTSQKPWDSNSFPKVSYTSEYIPETDDVEGSNHEETVENSGNTRLCLS